ncbi:hypothetical protein PACTADRAFT_49787 [Pachysolen tannophilus NRRL Y-2460]|uniref:CRT10-domain-containing protein n=1 Tax=Pachysolen tannophilus NRRL Y-2460 TaxID=669874 RepID=A0A1E4TXG2_PACTA|nr:hypothetical protein PACTADRAFT_49787 [Pachysolen tannophilus NRRL Y-2460]
MSDPAINLLQELASSNRALRDNQLSTPNQDPSSPFISPPSTSNSLCIINSNQQPMDSDERIRRLALKSQDADHRRRFERYLNDCGIKRQSLSVVHSTHELNYIVSELLGSDREYYNNDNDTESFYDENYENEDNDYVNHRLQVERERHFEEFEDADAFYRNYGSGMRIDHRNRNGSLLVRRNDGNVVNFDNLSTAEREAIVNEEINNNENNYHDELAVVDNDDNDFVYIKTDNSANNAEPPDLKLNGPYQLPENPQESFLYWENHSQREKDEYDGKFGCLYNISDFRQLTEDAEWAIKYQPAIKFNDSLDLKFLGIKKLNYEYGKKYKNNLSVVSDKYQILFTAANSEIFLYNFNDLERPNTEPILRFETRLSIITDRDRAASTWPYFPFTINFMKIGIFLNKEVLAVTCDNGRVLIWFTDLLIQEVKHYNKLSNHRIINNGYFGINIKPDFELRVEKSAWSIDFYNRYNMIAVSDNSQTISLFYLATEHQEAKFYTVSTHQALHNIPDINFIKDDDDDDDDDVPVNEKLEITVFVSCASISCELLVFEFKMTKVFGPLPNNVYLDGDDDEYMGFEGVETHRSITIDTEEDFFRTDRELEDEDEDDQQIQSSLNFKRVKFAKPIVISRAVLGDDVWTTNFIDGKFFKEVGSLKSMTGDPWLDEKKMINKIILQNEKLDVESDPCLSSDLGLVARFQNFDIPTILLNRHHPLGGGNDNNFQLGFKKPFNSTTDSFRRIRKIYDEYYLTKQRSKIKNHKSFNGKNYWEPIIKTKFNNKFLIVTTSSKMGLFRCDKLLCNASCKSVFDFTISYGEEASYSNRLSITQIIPELSCIVSASQIGLVTIMRLCSHRGCYAFRQEYIFPNANRLALGDRGYRTITGVATRKMIPINEDNLPKYIIYITYIDGAVLTYQLEEKDDGGLRLNEVY